MQILCDTAIERHRFEAFGVIWFWCVRVFCAMIVSTSIAEWKCSRAHIFVIAICVSTEDRNSKFARAQATNFAVIDICINTSNDLLIWMQTAPSFDWAKHERISLFV